MLNNSNNTTTAVAKVPSPPIDMTPICDDMDDIWGLITSPLHAADVAFGDYINESPLFGDSSPLDETPLMDTPALDGVGYYGMDTPDIYCSPAILDYNSFESTTGVGVADLPSLMGAPAPPAHQSPSAKEPAISFEGLFRMPNSPEMSALPPSALHTPQTPELHSMPSSSPAPSSGTQASSTVRPRKKPYNGTRTNITVDALIPVDAPIQPRNYLLPSATSRKDFPAHFRKRTAAQADLAEDDAIPIVADTTIVRQIEAKRQSNTLAARRSRHRKQQYLQQLENEIEQLREEKDIWRERALKAEAQVQQASSS